MKRVSTPIVVLATLLTLFAIKYVPSYLGGTYNDEAYLYARHDLSNAVEELGNRYGSYNCGPFRKINNYNDNIFVIKSSIRIHSWDKKMGFFSLHERNGGWVTMDYIYVGKRNNNGHFETLYFKLITID